MTRFQLSSRYPKFLQKAGFFSKITDIVTSILSWSVSTFGNTAGKILGWLGIGTPALFILWVIKKIIGHFINKFILEEWDIRYIAEEKYGFVHHDNSYRNGHEVYSEWTYAGFTWYGVYFCDDGVRTYKGLFADETDFMSYDELRNDYITMESLKFRYEGFPDEFLNALMELREA